LKNNRGINDGKNLPDEFLEEIYDEIATNEIKMKDEHEAAEKHKKEKEKKITKDDFGKIEMFGLRMVV
jgi:Sec7-like guanine-nucleotide exchange factor